MKRIVFESATDTINVEKIPQDHPILGFVFNNAKGFLVKLEYNSFNYRAASVSGFERGNGWSYCGGLNRPLKEWFEFFKETPANPRLTSEAVPTHCAWFLFDTPKELFAWLAE